MSKCSQFTSCIGKENLSCLLKYAKCMAHKDNLHTKIVCEENGKKYELVGLKGVLTAKYRVDDGIITGRVPKCDYLVLVYGKKPLVICVELKGHDIHHAMDQLTATCVTLGKDLASVLEDCCFAMRIVASKGVTMLHTDRHYLNLKRILLRLNRGNVIQEDFKLKSITLTERID